MTSIANVYPDLSTPAIAVRLQARQPHTAMAAHVDAHGSDAARDLYTKAAEFDSRFFGGKLGPLVIEIASPASPAALATHEASTPEGVACVIRIAPSVVNAGQALAYDALLHEMVHVWQTVAEKREPGYQGHGPNFAEKCNEIGAVLGLPPVGVKGKGPKGVKLPDCAQWPLNVRPDGYYGTAPRAVKAVSRATKARKRAATVAAVAEPQTALERALAALSELTPSELDQMRSVMSSMPTTQLRRPR